MTDIRENRPAAPPRYLRAVLTPKQYRYYTAYLYGNQTLADISIDYDVSITTVCKTIKRARERVLQYLDDEQRKASE